MTPLETELAHLVRLATRQSWDTDYSHDQWVQFVTRKAAALAARPSADYAGLPAALAKAMQPASNANGPNQSCTNE
jgi:hypothetical protein